MTKTTSDVLAHEFGHSISIAKNPVAYAQTFRAIDLSSYNCQNPSGRNETFSKDALDWQYRYKALYKAYKNMKK